MEEIIYNEVVYVDASVTYFEEILNNKNNTCDCFNIYKDGNSSSCKESAYAYIFYNYRHIAGEASFVALCVQHFYLINSIDNSNLIKELSKPLQIVYNEEVKSFVQRYLNLKDIL